jgi:hypothetical protein
MAPKLASEDADNAILFLFLAFLSPIFDLTG